MDVAIILPARLKSTRLPNKLLLDGSGKTILEHTIQRAKEAIALGLHARIIVAADDESLLIAARRAGATAVMTDPNHQSGTDRVAEAAAEIPENIIVNLQADEPEIDPRSIKQVAALLADSAEKASMATLAVQITNEESWKRPNIVKVVMSAAGYALYFSRSPVPFMRDPDATRLRERTIWNAGQRVFGLHHIGIYAYRREFLLAYKNLPFSDLENLEKLEQLRALEAGHCIKVGLAGSNPPGIDTPEDYQAFLARQRHNSRT